MGNNLRLERVRVEKLFDRFTYDIGLDNGYDVSILIAPNGCGKTTIFNLIEFMFNPTVKGYESIVNVPFSCCECMLSNGKTVKLEWQETHEEKAIAIEAKTKEEGPFDFMIADQIREKSHKKQLMFSITGTKKKINITKQYEFFKDRWSNDEAYFDGRDDWDAFVYEYWDDLNKNRQDIPVFQRRLQWMRIKCFLETYEYLNKNKCGLNINYIKANRLKGTYVPHRNRIAHEIDDAFTWEIDEKDPLTSIQENTRRLYKKMTDKYNNLQREMKDRLPKLYLEKNEVTMDFKTFKEQWEKYIEDIERYRSIGIINSDEKAILDMSELEEAFEKKGPFLEVYLDAFKKTLEPLEEQYDRLELFVHILDSRNSVTGKSILFGEKGIRVVVDGKNLPLECLSSGEKNDLVMFYKLIFNSRENGLVLIDEPEISLHIEWQEEYLDHLLDICEMNGLQAFVATHSPNIVNGHFELYADRGLIDDKL